MASSPLDENVDRLLDGAGDDEDTALADLAAALGELRGLREAELDPELEETIVRAMRLAVAGNGRRRRLFAPRPLLTRTRVAVVFAVALLVGSVGISVASGPNAPLDAAHALLRGLGLEDAEEDRRDRARDEAERARDEAEREAERRADELERRSDDAERQGEAIETSREDEVERPASRRSSGSEDGPVGRRKAPQGHTGSARDWAACVRTQRARHDASDATSRFDPVKACGAMPPAAARGPDGAGDGGGRSRPAGAESTPAVETDLGAGPSHRRSPGDSPPPGGRPGGPSGSPAVEDPPADPVHADAPQAMPETAPAEPSRAGADAIRPPDAPRSDGARGPPSTVPRPDGSEPAASAGAPTGSRGPPPGAGPPVDRRPPASGGPPPWAGADGRPASAGTTDAPAAAPEASEQPEPAEPEASGQPEPAELEAQPEPAEPADSESPEPPEPEELEAPEPDEPPEIENP